MNEQTFLRVFNGAVFIVFFILTFAILWSFDLSFIIGHDEAVYATEARKWLTGSPADQFEIYRPVAIPFFAWLVLHFSDSERALRLVGIIFGSLLPGTVYMLFRQISNVWVSISIALVAGTSYLFFEQAPRLLDDVPATVLLLTIMCLLYMHYKSGGTSRSVVFAAPLGALAFYLRYGAITPLIVIVVCSYFFLFPVFMRRKNPEFKLLGWTIVSSIVLLLPHFIYSIAETGQALGVMQLAGKAAHRIYLGEGLSTYLEMLPKGIGGWVMGDLAIIGLVCLLVAAPFRWRESYIGLTWFGVVGLGSFILTGILVHAEPRYVFFPMILLSGVGVLGLYYFISAWSQLVANALLGVLFIVTINFAILHYLDLKNYYEGQVTIPNNAGYVQALAQVKNDAKSSPCIVWTTLDRPRASWYTGCFMPKISDRNDLQQDLHFKPGLVGYSIVDTKEPDTQITPDSANTFGVMLFELYRTQITPDREFIVYKIYSS